MADAIGTRGEARGEAGIPAAERASVLDWVAIIAGALGALMASLDVSITNSALPQIQGSIGATGTEGTWISTGYLTSEIVMIPLTAWLTRVFGMRNFLLVNSALFIVFSMVCGLSHSLTQMIIGRVGQGFTGGALVPTAQTIIRMRLPRSQMAVGMTLFGMIVLLAPLLGPVVGGWITENVSWTWCFFLNLPVCILLLAMLVIGLPAERKQLKLFRQADWIGIAGIAIGLSSLTVILEEGERNQWFESNLIVALACVSACGIVLVVISQWTSAKPVLNLNLLRNASYASVILIVTATGATSYSVVYLVPQFLSLIAGYNAQQSGSIILVPGVMAVVMVPFLPLMLNRVDHRILLIVGLLSFVWSCMMDVDLTAQSVGHDFLLSQVLRGFGQMLMVMPLNQTSMAAVSRDEAGDAAGIYNMARNLGGSFGLSMIGILIDRRTAMHTAMIRESITSNSVLGQDRLAAYAAGAFARTGDLVHAKAQALAQLAAQIAQQATVITFSESFYVLGLMLLACVPFALLLKPPKESIDLLSSGH
jgi:DHA2 family multidrug resistance protein